jgi:glycosyltransferase involved in cell wall biosynthesis
MADRVHLLGLRSDTEDILAGADVFAMCSLHEGMPLAIMEAMFAGRAVVSSAAGGIGEMIADGVDGLLTPVGDADGMAVALERVLTDRQLRDRLAQAGRERADRQFSIGAMMDAYVRLYNGHTDRPV